MRLALSIVVVALLASACATNGGTEPMSAKERTRAAQANMQLGVQYLRRGDLQQALRKLDKAVSQEPDNSDAHMVMGIVYERLDDDDKAAAQYRKAVSLDGKNSAAQNNFGRFLCERGHYERAKKLFERAAANPTYDNPEIPLANAGVCAMRADKTDEAEDYLLRALKINPKMPTALLRMAQLRYEGKQYLSARGYLQRYLAAAKQTPESAWLGVRIEHKLGDRDAVASYKLLLNRKFPDSEETRQMLEWERDGRI